MFELFFYFMLHHIIISAILVALFYKLFILFTT
jgi:hypothetical protein